MSSLSALPTHSYTGFGCISLCASISLAFDRLSALFSSKPAGDNPASPPASPAGKTELIDLPNEVLHIIIYYIAIDLGVKRTVRLRLVCKKLADAVYAPLFETHLMDETWGVGMYDWQLRSQHGAVELWHQYLVHRVTGEQDESVGRFVEIRQIAGAFCQETEHVFDLQSTIEGLCWLTLKSGSTHELEKKIWGPTTPTTPRASHLNVHSVEPARPKADLGINLLSAAAHFGVLPLAKQLLAEDHSPVGHNFLFARPVQIAAQNGNSEMLKLFQDYLNEPQFVPWALLGAAIRGDLQILKLVFRTQDAEVLRNGGTNSQRQYRHYDPQGTAILTARYRTSNPEAYDYLTRALEPSPGSKSYSYNDLTKQALVGNKTMVFHLLHLGVPVQMQRCLNGSPLTMACRGLHNDMVDLLLEHGADPNFVDPGNPLYPLHEAATSSSLSIARKLLDHGASPNFSFPQRCPALFWAFARENVQMIRLLLEHGASFDEVFARENAQVIPSLIERRVFFEGIIPSQRWEKGSLWTEIVHMTRQLGYDSMTDILRQEYSLEITDPLPQPPWLSLPKPWQTWHEFKAVQGCTPDQRRPSPRNDFSPGYFEALSLGNGRDELARFMA